MAEDRQDAVDNKGAKQSPAAVAPSTSKARSKQPAAASLIGSSLAGRLLRRVPGGSFAERQLEKVEARVVQRLKQRLDAAGQPSQVSVLAVSVSADAQHGAAGGLPGNLLRHLLERSQEPRTKQQAEVEYFTLLLRELVPDEARILAGLSDGVCYPVIDVLIASKFSIVSRPTVECVSTVGKSAGVQAPDLTPDYVRHLRRLGLLDIVPQQTPEEQQYQILETDSEVRRAVEAAHKAGKRSQILRRSIRMSAVGQRLWAVCKISGE
ncbi:MAG: DUF4393 domain-containing protein [Nevskiaceae bacterium]|nr:MAG: DUF4393 domain-containing protein [Nevskiaceae bacterium]TBR71800.1 MAG: DUF4393 domain-containing protein [Nevskiaceae bacterium]